LKVMGMPGKAKGKKANQETRAELRGTIDQIEGDIVVVVFDDDQRLEWPRRFVPEQAKSGDAVIVKIAAADEAHWSGEGEAGQIALGKQSLQWPGEVTSGPLALAIEIDAEDTAARKERVRGLVDDIFSKP
jgi:hypothetical protein